MEEQGSGEYTEEELLRAATAELAQVQARIGPRFRRVEARSRAGRFLQALLAPVERKNGWQLAEELGEQGPRGVQRLLGEADWDEEAVRDDLRAYVIEHVGDNGGVLVVDETGFVKKGKKSAGVARQYSGTAGRRENSQIGVFLLYATARGAAFLDRALYLPEEWTSDQVRCREAGIPDEVGFATKGALARQMLSRAFAAGVPAEWVAGDTVYGYDELCLWLDSQQKNYVMAVPETYVVWVQGRQQPVGLLASLLPKQAWAVLSAGEGSKGPRLYEWAWLQLPEQSEADNERGRWILIRRNLVDPSKRAYYRVAGPATTQLPELVRVAGSRWKIEEGLEEAKGEVGLDQYEVRGYRAWYRFVTLALLAHAILVAVRAQANAPEKKVEPTEPLSG
ncbi:MAG TPA: IS701 family transposase [Ktedonobacteraceae bacterium]|nr:IS701 family transposase [Ktedonobacteraceae bacterium]